MFALADSVFMADNDERTEYVLNDTGYIYVGSTKNIRGRPWNFGQVRDCIFLFIYIQTHTSVSFN